MTDEIAVYLRHSSGRALMAFHVSSTLREQFQQAMQCGVIDSRQAPIVFEAPVLPEWTPDPNDGRHMRVTIDQIIIQFDDDRPA